MTTASRQPDYREAMRLADRHTEGESGPWSLRHFSVSEEAARLEAMRSAFSGGRGVPAGTYTGLYKGGRVWMSDTPDEMRDHYETYAQARRRGGRWLVLGLGLGMIVQALLSLDNIAHVDVVELDPDVIALVAPAFAAEAGAGRLTIHQGDALTFTFPKGTTFTGVYADIWPDLCTDYLGEMATIRRRYGRRSEWCDCWCRDLLLYRRRQERRYLYY